MFVHEANREGEGGEGHLMQEEELRQSKGVQNPALIWGLYEAVPVCSTEARDGASRDGLTDRAGKAGQRLEAWAGGEGQDRDSLEG